MAGGIRESRDDMPEELSEINVTPFIDVILVLLIIFMVAAPLATVDVPVDLPASTAKPGPRPDKPLYVSVGRDLAISVGNAPAPREALGPAIDAQTAGNKEARIFLRADRSVAYGDLMEVMNLLRAAGYLKVALVGAESFAAPAFGGPGAPPGAAPSDASAPAPGGAAVPGPAAPGTAIPGALPGAAPAGSAP